ncbi:Similar to phosphoglycolate phosphatase, clustered with ribosomal large subunit pseudouridine synthase C [hydrothermal vent metagenome]|uniref:Similar to phosphoglycolate phosphatase, clustered with ribosomal large subunit pseudouridine synthase C n=1 Tax=hydrothermal vent metagenome TaxID=652676 RepID=A0A3B0VN79_9ZZZZ
MMKKYKAIIFDWDGTLMNSENRIVNSIQYAAKACGFPVLPHDESKQIIGLSLENAILGLYPNADQHQVVAMAEAYTQFFLEECDVLMEAFDGAEALLYNLSQSGVKLAIATGKSRKGLNQILKESGFGVYFDMTRTPVESASKPDPLMLEQILTEFNLSADEAVMIGDTTFDMEMAQNIGMDRVALSHGVHQMEVLSPYAPVAELDSLQALNAWLLPRL